ncbi:MAG: prepilin-type N-terminal cleavage/methylation domain-containing protein [Bacilli bacterium]|nr:MAG: prepilin-type N-terminal cleavage/methylation domain-containing protein [Bacilli bacterium]
MNRRGFTLIEVILVIVIIAILSLILIPNVMLFVDKKIMLVCAKKLKDNIISSTKMYVNEK